MKKSLHLILALLAIGLGSCQEENVPRFQESDLMGEHSDKYTELTFNGEKIDDPTIYIVDPNNDKEGICERLGIALDPQFKYAILQDIGTIYSGAINEFVEFTRKSISSMPRYVPAAVIIPIEIYQNGKDITFEGSFTEPDSHNGHIVHHLKGRYGANRITIPALSAEYTRQIEDCKLVGKTFELKIDENGFFPIVRSRGIIDYNGEQLPTDELCLQYFELLRKNFAENTGGNVIRFTFNQDGTMSVAIPHKGTAEYDELPCSKFYVGDYKDLIISQGVESLYTILNSFATSMEGTRFYGMYGGAIAGVPTLTLDFGLSTDGNLKFTPVIYECPRSAMNVEFMSPWHIAGDHDNTPDEELGALLLNSIVGDRLEFEPYFIASQVNR